MGLFQWSLGPWLFAFACFCFYANAKPSYNDAPFSQDYAALYLYSNQTALADWAILPFPQMIRQVEALEGTQVALLLTDVGIYSINGDTGKVGFINISAKVVNGSRIVSPPNTTNMFVLATPTFVTICYLNSTCEKSILYSTPPGSIWGAASLSQLDYYFASDNGLFHWNVGSSNVSLVAAVTDRNLTCVAVTPTENGGYALAVGSATKLWLYSTNYKDWRYEWVGGIIDDPITAMEFDGDGILWTGNQYSLNLVHKNFTFQEITGVNGGLPKANVTSLSWHPGKKSMYIGSTFGASRRASDGTWSFYYGPRWLPGKEVPTGMHTQSLSVIPILANETVVIATDGGLSVISFRNWTLAQKAEHYQKMIYPRHFRYGLTCDCNLEYFGNLSSWEQTSSANSGLWTSIYLASQCFRYAITKDPDAKKAALAAFNGMEFLVNVTGIYGYPARSVWKSQESPGNGWFPSPTYPGWWFNGDTSSDEIVGHLFVYPIFYDLVAESSEEKQRALRLIYDITHGIIQNDYFLIGENGPTEWGCWNPFQLNHNYTWFDDRGLNSLQILSWTSSAYKYTGDQYFLDSFNYLVKEHQYDWNIINQKITNPEDDNFSDDELAFLTYLCYIWTGMTNMKEAFTLSLTRAFNIARPERVDLWNFIFGASYASTGSDFNLGDAIETLQQWPPSQIDWPTNNIIRQDIQINRDLDREGTVQSIEVLPYDEMDVFRWNSNPYEVGPQGSGYNECDPSAWLMPYWMGRYYGWILDEASS